MNEQWVVALGDAFEGIDLVGPFDDVGTAMKHAEENSEFGHYHVIELKQP